MNNPTLRERKYFFDITRITKKDFIRLSLFRFYVPKEVRILLQLDLEKKIKDFCLEDQVTLQCFLKPYPQVLLFLQQTTLWSCSDWFGNMISKQNKLDKYLKLKFEKHQKVKTAQRKRGYHDHGSRRPDHKWKPDSDFSLTSMQIEIELKRETLRDTLTILEGMIT